MTKKTDSGKTWRRNIVWKPAYKKGLGILLLFLIFRFIIYPEYARMKEYREEMSIEHQVARGYIDRVINKGGKLHYVFIVDGVEYSGYPGMRP